ncbi:MaoC family dehydratase [Thermodesulfobacteriota bacterium]
MFFEEFVVGKQAITPERTITVAEIDAFLDISGLHLPMFMSDEGARKVGHEKRIVPGPLILSVTMGLVKETGWFDHVIAVAEFSEMRFIKGLQPDQQIKARVKVIKIKPTQNLKRGLVILEYTVINQMDEVILTAKGRYLIQKRNQG